MGLLYQATARSNGYELSKSTRQIDLLGTDLGSFAAEAEHAQANLQAAKKLNDEAMANYERVRDLQKAGLLGGALGISKFPDSTALQQKFKESVDAYDRARAQMSSAQDQMERIRAIYTAEEAKQVLDLSRSQAQPHSKAFDTSLNTLGNQFKYRIPVKPGQATFNDGNRIEILRSGNETQIRDRRPVSGASQIHDADCKRGKLYFYETTSVNGGISTRWICK